MFIVLRVSVFVILRISDIRIGYRIRCRIETASVENKGSDPADDHCVPAFRSAALTSRSSSPEISLLHLPSHRDNVKARSVHFLSSLGL